MGQDSTNNRLIFGMPYPSKISNYYSLSFNNISTPTTFIVKNSVIKKATEGSDVNNKHGE